MASGRSGHPDLLLSLSNCQCHGTNEEEEEEERTLLLSRTYFLLNWVGGEGRGKEYSLVPSPLDRRKRCHEQKFPVGRRISIVSVGGQQDGIFLCHCSRLVVTKHSTVGSYVDEKEEDISVNTRE